ncbi:hypothetical protein [Nostoc sp. PCC 7524]|uniref:hypothetical protein n=1 Tax=Nostoc sp. (strain ATCC 29411 / PCC 7524) TaxID=28072 RepID=UPI000A5910D3|nr:hypothetical protein [Nostoc sp. PCC 7524]
MVDTHRFALITLWRRSHPAQFHPLTQLSIQYSSSPEHHYQIGQALRSLRAD